MAPPPSLEPSVAGDVVAVAPPAAVASVGVPPAMSAVVTAAESSAEVVVVDFFESLEHAPSTNSRPMEASPSRVIQLF
ncbi:MAG: hypothetical protein JJD93_04235 [Ilumatobacteraceae bacterium]|nr:hypothetical protein [Ilumatobacteraceae bacterium]